MFKLKALELVKKTLERAEDLVRPAVKESTVPEGFELQMEKRLQERQVIKSKEDEEKLHNFFFLWNVKLLSLFPFLHGLNKTFLCQQGLPEKKILPAAVPESPAFALKKRVHREIPVVEV